MSSVTGNPATPVIVDAYLKGLTNFEVEKAYEGMRKNAMEKPDPDEFRPRQNYPYITEGSPLHWTWHVMHDPRGLIELLGGDEKFIEKLENALMKGEAYKFGDWNPWYNQSNQPVMHAVYLFNNAGVPWKTQKWVRAIMDKSYGVGPDGMIGNDDVGTMSAWFVFGAMGFYPVAPGELVYSIGSPLFDRVTIHLPDYLYGGKDFTIIAENNSPEKFPDNGKLPAHKVQANRQLYNLDEDIGETNNLITEYPEIAAQLEQELNSIRSAGNSIKLN